MIVFWEIWAFVPNWLKLGAVAVAAVLLAYNVGHWRGDDQGYARYQAEQAAANIKAENARKKDDAKIQGLSNYDACVIGLRRRGLPIDACEQLRGL